jgi:ornithine decarboxylase
MEAAQNPACRRRVREWCVRYAPAEVAAVLGALLAAGTASRFGMPAVTAVAGVLGESVAFYAVLAIRDLRVRCRYRPRDVATVIRDLILEFGPAEALDTFLVRPGAMYLGPVGLGNVMAGVLLGKIAADIVFYLLAIAGYELRKSLMGNGTAGSWPTASHWKGDPLAPAALDRLSFATPYLLMDLDRVERTYLTLAQNVGVDAIHYAVKCNPEPRVLETLHALGCRFEVASHPELAQLIEIGVDASQVLYSNPVKPAEHIRLARRAGCWRFAADSTVELAKIADCAPGSAVYIRLRLPGKGGSRVHSEGKFGVDAGQAIGLLRQAREFGLHPYGLTFHVGSQMTRRAAWADAIGKVAPVMHELHRYGIRLEMVDIGGGFPVRYTGTCPEPHEYGALIRRALDRLPYRPLVVAEPGRALVAETGVLVTTVIGTAVRARRTWVHLDIGAFNGMMEALETGNTLRYPVSDSRRDAARERCHLTGPTCDSQDTILFDVPVSAGLVPGNRVYIGAAGAYTTAYASRFNGFDAPATYCAQAAVLRPESSPGR